MKAKFNYKSKKTIIIIAIAAILLVAAIVGTVAFIKGNQESAAAMTGNEEISTPADNDNNGGLTGSDTQNSGDEQENPQIPTVGDEDSQTTVEDGNATANENGGNADNTTNNGTANNAGTTTGTTASTVPNQEYTQTTTQITEQPWETTLIGWTPITVSASTVNLGINKAELQKIKLVYVGNDSLDKAPVTTVAQKGDELTYVIKVINASEIDAKNIKIYDSIPEGTEYVENSISDNGTIENGDLSWKIDIAKGETKTVSFKVTVVSEEFSVIDNTAKVDGGDTNEVHTPIITKYKTSELIVKDENGVETVEDRDAKVGETIRYKINVVNTSEYAGTTPVYDIVPEGTTLVEGSISNECVVETTIDENGIETNKIVWDNVHIAANDTTTVSFDVTVNEKKINPETLLEEYVTIVKNKAVVGNNETNEVEDKVANINTVKTSVGIHADGTPVTEENPLHELDKITYTLTSTNYGEGTGSVVITDELPDGTTIESKIVDSDGNEYTEQELENGITLTLKPEETKTITFTVTINPFKATDETEEVDGVIIKHIKNLVAKQDGTPIPGTDDPVEKEYKRVSATKIFVDKENIDNVRPTSVLVGLFTDKDTEFTEENALNTATLTDTNKTVIFDKLDKYDLETSEEITYTVKEINVDKNYKDSYVTTVDGDNTTIEITNTLKYENVPTEKTASKIWLDNDNADRPESVTLAIYDKVRDYKQTQSATKDENGNWEVTFTNLQKYREDGTEIEYTFDEPTVPNGYVKEVNGNTITNKLPEIEVVKTIISVGDTYIEQDDESQANVTVKAGDIVEYQIIVTNTGNVTLNHVTLEDVLENNGKVYFDKELTQQANTIVGYDNDLTLEPEENETYTVYYQLTEEDTANVEKNPDLQNKVIAKGYYDVTDKNGEVVQNPDPVTDDDTAEVNFKREPSLSIVKEQYIGDKKLDKNETTTKLQPGQVIDYTITITNTGNTNLTEVEFTDVMDVAGSARKVDEIISVKVNKTNRTYSVVNDTTIRLNGVLAVGDELVITAKYTVQETDMSADKENTIKNTATVDTKETTEEQAIVNVPTIIWKTDFSIGKEGFLKNDKGAYTVNADGKTVVYNDTIKYVLTVTNKGKKPGTYTVQDADIKTLVNDGNITGPATITVKDYKTNGTSQTRTVSSSAGKTTADKLNEGIDVYLLGESSVTVEFIVTVKATAGTKIINTVDKDTVTNPVVKSAKITSSSYEPKNIVIVLDLSSSMLKIAGTDSYPSDCYVKNSKMPDSDLLNKSTETRLYHAKQATKQFITDILNAEPENSITLVTFNYDTYEHAETGIKQYKENGESLYWTEVKKAIDNTDVENYMKTQILVKTTSDEKTLTDAIDNIYLTYPLLTNVVAALEKTEDVVESLEKSTKYKDRDTEIVFIGDGKPSYNTEACGKDGVGFYSESETYNKISQISSSIKGTNSSRAHIYTVEYAVAGSETTDAKKTFNYISSGSSYRYTATMENLGEKLAEIGEAIISPPSSKTYTSNVNGDIEVSLPTSTKLKIDTNHKLILQVGSSKAIEVTAQNQINTKTNGIVEYDADKKKLIIHAGKTAAKDSISLSYYYQK